MTRRAISKWDGLSAAQLRRRWARKAVTLYGRIDSTNDAARDLAEKGAPSGAVVVCREQTRGHGRVGRGWYSPRDAGLYSSMVFHPRDLTHPAPLSILGGLGVVRALDEAFPDLRPRLKWPNDIIAGDRKLGGVLAEAVWVDATPRFLVVGVGINVRPITKSAPASVRRQAASMDEILGRKVRLVEVADAAIAGLEAHMEDPPPVLSRALLDELDGYDWLRDRRARVTLPGEETGVSGMCVGIAPDGALLFRPDRGALRRVPVGTVEAEE